MNDDLPATDTPAPGSHVDAGSVKPASDGKAPRIIVRMWPKTPVLYPMAVCALVCAILSHFYGVSRHLDLAARPAVTAVAPGGAAEAAEGQPAATEENLEPEKLVAARRFDRVLACVFLAFFAVAMFSMCVDFEIRWALIAIALFVILVLGLVIANTYWHTYPGLVRMLTGVTALASPQFYLAIFLVWAVLMVVSLVIVRFHYVKIESNELVVVGGFLETQKRLSTFRMNYTKEVQDVLEYYLPLVRSGRLIFTFPGDSQAVIVENVLHIDRVIEQLDKLGSSFRVEDAHLGE